MLVKVQSNRTILYTNLAASRGLTIRHLVGYWHGALVALVVLYVNTFLVCRCDCKLDDKNEARWGCMWWRWDREQIVTISLQWRHDGCDGVSNHQLYDCLHNRLYRRRSKKTSKLRVTGLCAGKSPVTGEFPAQMASNAENVSIWLRHHVARQIRHYILI